MADEPVELAAKDVFVLLGVPVPENLETGSKWQEQGDTKDDDDESHFSLDEDDKVQINAVTEPPVIDITPTEELDYSSSDSLTLSEIEEKRWYNPKLVADLEKSDFDSLKGLLEAIKNTDPTETLAALSKLKTKKIVEEPFQNMFIALNGFEVLINILECNNNNCVKESLFVIHEMSQQYGAQCSLCHLDAVKLLISILLLKKNITVRYLATDTLRNISKLRIGRKLIRLSGGVQILVQMMQVSKKILFTPVKDLNASDRIVVRLVNSCSGTLKLLCRSLKSQEDLWNAGFIKMLPQLLNTKHSEIQISIMSLIKECCSSRPETSVQKTNILYKTAVKELNLLPQIIQFMISSSTELAAKSAITILDMLEDDPSLYDVLLKQKGMDLMLKSIRKFHNEAYVMLSVITLLWKSSLNPKCRQVLEKNTVVSHLLELLSYEFDDMVISYAVATLSELWKAEFLRFQLRDSAIPKYLELLETSLHSQILARVCTALGRASSDSDSMKMINEVNGFRLIFVILPSLGLDEFDKYDDFYNAETIVAAAECLTEMIINTPSNQNILKGMYGALHDLVDLLEHKNLDILAAICRLIEVVALFDENLQVMINAGVIENLAKLVYTGHSNLRANVCRALGKCCYEGVSARNLSCINIVDELLKYTKSKHRIVRENVPLALSGLSEDPLNCVKIEALGFLPFLKQCVKSINNETAMAAVNCMKNVRKACSAIGQYAECSTKI